MFSIPLKYVSVFSGEPESYVVLRGGTSGFTVEGKHSGRRLDKLISCFMQRTPIPEFYQVHLGQEDTGHAASGGRILPLYSLCDLKQLP